MCTIGATPFSGGDDSLADDHPPGTGWLQKGHATVKTGDYI